MLSWRCNGASQGEVMKRIFAAALAALVYASSPLALADAQSDAKAFTDGLNNTELSCTSAYGSARLDQQLAAQLAEQQRRNYGTQPDESATEAKRQGDLNTFMDCREGAKAKGEALYRAFLATTHTPELKADAKQVFVAWLSYLGRATGETSDYESREWTDFKKAMSTLEVDAMAP